MARSPFSGSETTRIWGRKGGRPIYQCVDTGAVFFDRAQLGAETYDGYYPYLKAFDRDRSAWELSIRRRRYQRQLALMRRYAPGTRLLDIGAGPGYLVRVALERGFDAAGVEVSPPAVEHGRERFGVRYVALTDVAAGSIDIVTCHHVLEHLPAPGGFLEVVRRTLAPGGLLVVHVPHQQPLSSVVRDRVRPGVDTRCSLYDDIHISGFTEASLRRTVERFGFTTRFTRTIGQWAFEYDPFFLRNYTTRGDWAGIAKKAARGIVDTVGAAFGLGDWVVGYFTAA